MTSVPTFAGESGRGRTGLPLAGQVVVLLLAVVGGLAAGLTGSLLPTLALAGAAVLASMLALPSLATLVFVFALYANVPAVAVQEYGVPYAIAAAPVALLLIPLVGLLLRREPILIAPIVPVVGAYLLVLLVSSIGAVHFDVAMERLQLQLAEGLLLVFLITNVVRTPTMLRATVVALLVAGVFMAGLTVFQELTGTYDSTYGGFARVAEGGRLGEEGEIVRAGGPVAEHNRYAQILLVLVPLAAYGAVIGRGLFRFLGLAGAFVIVAGMYLTFSRGAALGLFALALLAIALRLVRARWAVPVVLLGVLAMALVAPEYVERVQTLPEVGAAFAEGQQETDLSILGRLTLNLAAWQVFLDHPLLGAGPGNFSALSVEYTRDVGLRPFATPFEAHNLYLEVLAETGIVGLAAFGLLLGYLFVGLMRRRRELAETRPADAALATALLFSLAAYAVTGTFLHLSYERYFWILVALAGAAIFVLRPGAASRNRHGADGA